ncbi:Hint domain-containing protein [Marimonas arenosa]|uniref:Hint domain-containing protein n=1 Tax=Marimonas arenosa TaxID=1795305 RepID=A0AAE3WEU0_9RHOB|nr:Hint domain-containing protein [Marimonas arenosa]MDQ2091208.1 Hint domain-containing protein [Marimonas arenosa]
MAVTFEVLYLGTAPEIDTAEGNVLSENDGALVGMTFGSTDAPLAYNAQHTLSPVGYSGGTSNMYDIDNTISNDTFSIDGGPAQTFDGLAVYNATITYADGTPSATITAVVIQDADGNLYLVPETSANADHAAMTAAPIASITLDSIYTISSGRLVADRQSTDFVCYALGTDILTDRGNVPVECLRPGNHVMTLDRGAQPIRWIHSGMHLLDAEDTDAKPVLIGAGALGPGRPARDLIVSPQHRVLVGSNLQLQDFFGAEALAPAKFLTRLPGIRHMKSKRDITWVHFACDRHELVYANGCLSESLLLGPMVLNGMTHHDRRAAAEIFGQAPTPDAALNGPPARDFLRKREVQAMLRPRNRCRKVTRPHDDVSSAGLASHY